MSTNEITLEVLNPRARIHEEVLVHGAERLKTLDGKKIGILDNGKPCAEILPPYFEDALKSRFTDMQFRTWKIPLALANKLKEAPLKEMVDWCDGVIALSGD
ncbi:hypothetical protein ACFLWU_06160 [Chloroflexota bacterium]